MNDTTITCPKCGAEVPLSEAVSHRIREQLARDFETKRREHDSALAAREQKLLESQAALEQQQRVLEKEVERRLTTQKQQLVAEARQQAQENLALEMKDLQGRLAEQKQRLDAARTAELDLRKRQRELEAAKQALELEVSRRLDAECAKIRGEAQKAAAEAERLKLAEKEKVIADLQREIHNLKQKAEQGSMQLQGEVLELDLEARLSAEFPSDGIDDVAKGQRGADMLQRVHSNTGQDCGAILWEAKRAKNWGGNWTTKLKEDQRAAKADLAVLVSQILPEDVHGFGLIDGVWVCDFATVIPLAVALRQGLVTAALARHAEVGRQGKVIVVGAVEREGQLRLQVIRNADRKKLHAFIHKNTAPDNKAIYTDEWQAYKGIADADTRHETVNHSKEECVHGDVHTNTVKNVWSLLKRSIIEAYHKVSMKHLDAYLDELEFRFNNRNNEWMFRDTLRKLVTSGKVTFEQLTKAA